MAGERPAPVTLEIPSDDDCSPAQPPRFKKPLDGVPPSPLVFVIADDPTPQKPTNQDRTPSFVAGTPSFVAETPMSSDHALGFSASIVKCTFARSEKLKGISGLICLESDSEPEGFSHKGKLVDSGKMTTSFALEEHLEATSKPPRIASPLRRCSQEDYGQSCTMGKQGALEINGNHNVGSTEQSECGCFVRGDRAIRQIATDAPSCCEFLVKDVSPQLSNASCEELRISVKEDEAAKCQSKHAAVDVNEKNRRENVTINKQPKEEKARMVEERKRKRQQEKLQKEALKAEAAKMRKLEKEKQKWEKGKFALKAIVAEIDARIVEDGSVGGHLLTRLAEKGLSFHITSNPIEKSILWKMNVPNQIAQLSSMPSAIPYVLLVLQAEEFCKLVSSESIIDHVHSVQSLYPSFTVCYLTNRLMGYINKCEQSQYKNQPSGSFWRRPPVEEVLAKLAAHFSKVHSRQCIDEAELADHIVGLTSSLANCQFRRKLTMLTVNANGSIIPKDFVDKNLIKKNVWLKALIAIPKVQPRFAVAIWKKYPTMRSLLNIYMDPNRSVHEKEFLLKDLAVEGFLGNEDRRLGEICSKRVYRILMAQNGGMTTDDAEDGADLFGC